MRANTAAKAGAPRENYALEDALTQNDSVHVDNAAVVAASEDIPLNSFESVALKVVVEFGVELQPQLQLQLLTLTSSSSTTSSLT